MNKLYYYQDSDFITISTNLVQSQSRYRFFLTNFFPDAVLTSVVKVNNGFVSIIIWSSYIV